MQTLFNVGEERLVHDPASIAVDWIECFHLVVNPCFVLFALFNLAFEIAVRQL